MTRRADRKEAEHRDIGADAETRTDEEIREQPAPERDQGAVLDVDANVEPDRRRDREAEGDRPVAG